MAKQRRNKITGRIERFANGTWTPIPEKEQIALDSAEGISSMKAALIEAGRQTQGILGAVRLGEPVDKQARPALDQLRTEHPKATMLGSTLPSMAVPGVGAGASMAARLGMAGGKTAFNRANPERIKVEKQFKQKALPHIREGKTENLGVLRGPTVKEAAKDAAKEAGKIFKENVVPATAASGGLARLNAVVVERMVKAQQETKRKKLKKKQARLAR